MERHHYPHLDAHRRHHYQLFKQIIDFQYRLRPGDVAEALAFLEFAQTALLDHVLTVDREYALFYASSHVVPTP